MKLADAPDVMTVEEAAQLARVGKNAMYEAVKRGDVWSARIGKSIRIPKSALSAFLGLDTNEAADAANAPTAPGVNRDFTTTPRRHAA